MHIRLVIHGINGEEVQQLDVSYGVSLDFVKNSIEHRSKIPSLCQQLLLDGEILSHNSTSPYAEKFCTACKEVITAAHADASSDSVESKPCLCLTLVIVTEVAYAKLGSSSIQDQIEGLNALKWMGSFGDEKSFSTVLKFVTPAPQRDEKVRSLAIEVLAHLSRQGQPAAVNELITCVPQHGQIGLTAARALGTVAEPGDVSAIVVLVENFLKLGWEAAEALMKLTPKGDAYVVRSLRNILTEPSALYQCAHWAAIKTLGKVAARGDEASTKAVHSFCAHHNAQIRLEAVRTLSLIAPYGHQSSLNQCCKLLLEDWHKQTQRAALDALQCLTKNGDDAVTAALCSCVQDHSKDLGLQAFYLLARIVPAQHTEAQRLLEELSEEWGVDLANINNPIH